MVGEVIQYHNRITPKPGEWVKLAVLDFSIKPGGGCVPHLRQSLKVSKLFRAQGRTGNQFQDLMDEKKWEHYSGPLPVLVRHFPSLPKLFKRWIYDAIHGINFCSVDRTIIYWCLLDDDLSNG